MAAGEKPYRVYKGGRTKGRVPLQTRPERGGGADGRRPGEPRRKRPRRRWSWRRRIAILVVGLILLLVAWSVASYFSFRSGVSSANRRLDSATRAALSHNGGFLLSHATTILLLGTDHSALAARAGDRHSDSIMLVRTDPGRHRIAFLSIPRDLQVAIPGNGNNKINAAMQIGGPPLAIRTIEAFTGLKVDHIVVVDFGSGDPLTPGRVGYLYDLRRSLAALPDVVGVDGVFADAGRGRAESVSLLSGPRGQLAGDRLAAVRQSVGSRIAVLTVLSHDAPQSGRAKSLLARLRGQAPPAGGRLLVSGSTASTGDAVAYMLARTPAISRGEKRC